MEAYKNKRSNPPLRVVYYVSADWGTSLITRKTTHHLERFSDVIFSRTEGVQLSSDASIHMELSRLQLSNATVFLLCTPLVSEKISSGIHPSRGCVSLCFLACYEYTEGRLIWRDNLLVGWSEGTTYCGMLCCVPL